MDVLSIGETMIAFSPNEVGPMRYARDISTHIA
ncbi:sugar kinase, partial [Gemella sp. WT2a]